MKIVQRLNKLKEVLMNSYMRKDELKQGKKLKFSSLYSYHITHL